MVVLMKEERQMAFAGNTKKKILRTKVRSTGQNFAKWAANSANRLRHR